MCARKHIFPVLLLIDNFKKLPTLSPFIRNENSEQPAIPGQSFLDALD